MKLATALLLLASPATAAPFDGVWQAGSELRFVIHGADVHQQIAHDGKFIDDRGCTFGIERKVRSAYISFLECASDDGLLVITDRFLLTKKDKDTLRVRTEKRNGRLVGDEEWTRVR